MLDSEDWYQDRKDDIDPRLSNTSLGVDLFSRTFQRVDARTSPAGQ